MQADFGGKINILRVDGGASANDLLMQFQSDISDVKVFRPHTMEATAAGAAFLAGLAVGFFSDREEIGKKLQSGKEFAPEMAASEREKLLGGWHDAVKAACCGH